MVVVAATVSATFVAVFSLPIYSGLYTFSLSNFRWRASATRGNKSGPRQDISRPRKAISTVVIEFEAT
jgi:hypothetical protein